MVGEWDVELWVDLPQLPVLTDQAVLLPPGSPGDQVPGLEFRVVGVDNSGNAKPFNGLQEDEGKERAS